MNMMSMNADSLSRLVGQPVDSLTVLIAKNEVTGLNAAAIADILGVAKDEIEEIQQTQLYRDTRLLLGAEHAKGMLESDLSWDALENMALANLVKQVPNMARDSEFNLKVAAVANKAQRRLSPQNAKVLDPSSGSPRVALQLTSRITERLALNGSRERVETRQISVMDGSATNPTFQDIDRLLGVSQRPRIADKMAVHTREPDFSIDDIVMGGDKNG